MGEESFFIPRFFYLPYFFALDNLEQTQNFLPHFSPSLLLFPNCYFYYSGAAFFCVLSPAFLFSTLIFAKNTGCGTRKAEKEALQNTATVAAAGGDYKMQKGGCLFEVSIRGARMPQTHEIFMLSAALLTGLSLVSSGVSFFLIFPPGNPCLSITIISTACTTYVIITTIKSGVCLRPLISVNYVS